MLKRFVSKVLLSLVLLNPLQAQIKVGAAGSNPNASAILELESDSKGFLPPRMNETQRDAIFGPPAGLLIYNTTSNSLEVCDGSHWTNIKTYARTPVVAMGSPSGNGGAGLGTGNPEAAAILDLSSNTKGFLPPRMTRAQRDLIASPPGGLIIYNRTDKRFEFSDGTQWISSGGLTTVNSNPAPQSYGDMGVGTTTPDPNASLDLTSTTQGFLLPRMNLERMENINNPVEGLMVYNLSTQSICYYNGTGWVIATGPCAGSPTSMSDKGYVYKPVASAGQCWLNNNLGASYANSSHPDFDPHKQASSLTDDKAYGHLFQWGRGADGHELIERNSGDPHATSGQITTVASSHTPPHDDYIAASGSSYDWLSPQNNSLWQGVNGTNNPCPSGYRLPTINELETERLSWSTNDTTGAYASPLKLTLAGIRLVNAGINSVGTKGYYWSYNFSMYGTVYDSGFLRLHNASSQYRFRVSGLSVLCIKN